MKAEKESLRCRREAGHFAKSSAAVGRLRWQGKWWTKAWSLGNSLPKRFLCSGAQCDPISIITRSERTSSFSKMNGRDSFATQ